MSFFYDLNKRLQQVAEASAARQLNESQDMSGNDHQVSTVVRLLKRLLASEALRDAYNIDGDDAYQIEELASALENNDMEAAQDAWSVFDVNELDNALDRYVADNGLETGYLFDLLGHNVNEGVAETKVAKHKDLGATNDTTHFVKNVTTGKIVSPHRSQEDAKDALVALNRRPDGNEYKIVRARKEGVAEGAEEGQGYYYLQGGIDKSKKFATKKEALDHVDQFIQHVRVTRVTLRHKEPGKPAVVVREFNVNESVSEGRHTQSNALELNPDLRARASKPTVAGRIGSAAKRVANAITGGSDEDAKNRLLNRMGGRRTPLARDDMSEATQEIKGGRRHTAEPGGYGRRDDDEAPKTKTQRGRGRPKKGGDSETGEVKKYDWSAFGATGKDVKLPKHSGTVTKHKMSDDEPKKVKEATKEIPGGRRHTAEPGGYGRQDDEDDKGKKVAAQVKRGRGRPKKGGDSETGEVKKYDWSAFGATGKDVKLPKHKGAVTRHKMDEAVSEDDLAVLERLMDQAFAEGNMALGNALQDALQQIQGDQDEGQYDDDEQVNEKAVSKKQQRFMGMVHAAQQGEKPASKEVAKVAKDMGKKDAKDFASTKHKGLPEKKKTDETADSKPAAGGFAFGKGIYDSMNRDVENLIAESMSINMSMNTDAGGNGKSLTVTATDEDADQLAQLLKLTGMGSMEHDHDHDYQEAACQVDENSPDWPTDPEVSDDPFQYSGGLNKPKRDVAGNGQATVPVTAVSSVSEEEEDELARMMEMAGVAEAKKAKPDFLDVDGDGDKTEPFKKAVADKKDDADQVDEGILSATRNLWKTYRG